MKKNKLFKIILFNGLVLAIFIPFFTCSASWTVTDPTFDPGSNFMRNSGLGEKDPTEVAASIVNWLLGILGLFALCLILYAGFLWMWSRGNEEEIEKAVDILKGTIIGVILILASYGIANYVFSNLINITEV